MNNENTYGYVYILVSDKTPYIKIGGTDYLPDDAPRDKCAHFREINGIAAAFQYLQKNYNPTASSFL